LFGRPSKETPFSLFLQCFSPFIHLFPHFACLFAISLRNSWAWELLGYDVCDEWLLSGLTDLAWGDGSPEEVQAICQKYVPSLNEYHLFTSVDSAAEFIPLAEEGARAHAPFFVFGLWLIKKQEGLAQPD
jgi:hypothetical protein